MKSEEGLEEKRFGFGEKSFSREEDRKLRCKGLVEKVLENKRIFVKVNKY